MDVFPELLLECRKVEVALRSFHEQVDIAVLSVRAFRTASEEHDARWQQAFLDIFDETALPAATDDVLPFVGHVVLAPGVRMVGGIEGPLVLPDEAEPLERPEGFQRRGMADAQRPG